jgi:hypothetical protein
VNSNIAFTCTNTSATSIVGTENLDFVSFSSGGIVAGRNLTKTGNTINFSGTVENSITVLDSGGSDSLTLTGATISAVSKNISFADINLEATGVINATNFSSRSALKYRECGLG